MSPDPSIPPLRELSPSRVEAHHAHLLREIGGESRRRLLPPAITWTSLRVAALAGASAAAAAAIALVVAGSWGGGARSVQSTSPAFSPELVYAFHASPARRNTLSPADYLPVPPGDTGTTSALTSDSRSAGTSVPRVVYLLARYQATANGDGRPTAVQWFKTTRRLAVASQSRDRVDSPRRAVYFVVLHGHFVDENAYYLGSAATAPRGTVLSFTIDRRSGQVLDFALARRSPDYSRLGRVHRFSFDSGPRTK